MATRAERNMERPPARLGVSGGMLQLPNEQAMLLLIGHLIDWKVRDGRYCDVVVQRYTDSVNYYMPMETQQTQENLGRYLKHYPHGGLLIVRVVASNSLDFAPYYIQANQRSR